MLELLLLLDLFLQLPTAEFVLVIPALLFLLLLLQHAAFHCP